MNNEIHSLISRFENVNTGAPWFGRAVYKILEEVDPKKVHINPTYPTGNSTNPQHSMAQLLYHMITWADFTLKRIEKDKVYDLAATEEMDWREINPKVHDWKKGLMEFKEIQNKIIELLKNKKDVFLEEKVDYRNYNFRFLINGMIEHTIYHLGQIAYLKKLLA